MYMYIYVNVKYIKMKKCELGIKVVANDEVPFTLLLFCHFSLDF